MAKELGVATRTIFRDLDTLKQAGVPLVYEESEQRYRIPTNYYLPPTNFTPQEALALLVLCYELGDRSGLPFQTSARQAALKLESNLPSKLRAYVHELAEAVRIRLPQAGKSEGHESTYLKLLEAVGGKRTVRMKYHSLSEQDHIATKLSPYQLMFSRRSWYVAGRSSLHREVRIFNLARIKDLEILDETFRVPARFNMERFLRNAWHLIPEPGPDRQVLVRFEPMVAHNVAEVMWHKTQQIEWRDDGRIDFRVTVSGVHEIAWWILGYGDQAEVIEPPELRQIVAERAKKMVAKYDV